MIAIAAVLPFATDGMLLIRILRGLHERGFDVTIAIVNSIAGSYPTDTLADFSARGRLVTLAEHSRGSWLDVLRSTFETNGVDLIIQNGAKDIYPLLPYLKQDRPNRAIVDLLFNPVGHTIDHFLFEACMDGVFVESRWMLEFIRKSTEMANRRVWVMESGVSLDEFNPSEVRVKPGRLEVGYAGRFSHEKNPEGFIELARALLQKDDRLSFSMYGFGPLEGALREQSVNLLTSGRFRFQGYVEKIQEALSHLDVLIVPSIDDGRPVAVMEAAASGVVVVASPVGGLPEMIVEGETGFIVPVADIERIERILLSMLDDDVLIKMKRQARAHAVANFNSDLMLDLYEGAFRELATAHRSGRAVAPSLGRTRLTEREPMRRHCVFCGNDVEAWHPYIIRETDISEFVRRVEPIGSNVERFACLHCPSIDRDRHLKLYFERVPFLRSVNGGKFLHIAPEPVLVDYFKQLKPEQYILGDLNPHTADTVVVDLENLAFDDNSFDLVIFNHVLEHVSDHRRALREAYRVMKPSARLICQTPFASRLTTTFEDSRLQAPEDRFFFYGQHDHVRMFGADIEDIIRQAGFRGGFLQHADLLPEIDPEEYGINEYEPFFDFIKPEH